MTVALATGWKDLPGHVLAEAGVTRDGDLVRVPCYTVAGAVHNARMFAPGGRCWWATKGFPLPPFGLERLEDDAFRRYRVLAITEGESDALALCGALVHEGLDALGVPGAGIWRDEWAQYARGYHAVYVFGDGDKPGRAFAWRVKRSIPEALIVNVPDGEDARSIIQGAGVDELVKLIAKAEHEADFAAWFFSRDRYDSAEAFLCSLSA